MRSTLSSGSNGDAEAGTPALRLAVGIDEDVGLQRGEALFAHLAADRLDAVEIGDRRLVPIRMIDAPGRAMRPVDPDAVADLAAEQFVAGHAERLCFHVEQRVLDRAERQRHHAAGGRSRRGKQFGIDSFVLQRVLADDPRRQPLDRGGDAGRAKAFVEFAPADQAVLGRQLDEVIVAPAGVAGKRFDAADAGCLGHDFLPGLLCVGR